MDEFAMGSNNTFSYFGKTLNPLFEEEVSTGGSSGGSAAAVAAKMCDVALGSDTGGSVRLPAAYCGVIGYKPSYGLISRYGVVAYAQSLDTVGILARNTDLVKKTFDILNKYDAKDPTSLIPSQREKLASRQHTREALKIGMILESNVDLSPAVSSAWIEALDYLRSLGHKISSVSLPSLKHSLPTYFILSPAEASSNLARYDGVRYGYRANSDRQADVLYGPTRTEGFGSEVQRRILLGTYNLSDGSYGNHYLQAQKVRRKIQLEFDSVFSTPSIHNPQQTPGDFDVLICPTARSQAPKHQFIHDHESAVESYVNDVLTVPANIAGIPAISVPWNKGKDTVGIQVFGQYGDDELVLEVASLLEAR